MDCIWHGKECLQPPINTHFLLKTSKMIRKKKAEVHKIKEQERKHQC